MDCDDIGIDFPELKMILAHCGRPMWAQGAIFIIRRFPDAYIDLSSIPPKRLLHYIPMLEKLANKCLWGTDWTRAFAVVNYKQAVEPFRLTDLLTESERATLMGGACARAYGWKPDKP